MGQLIDMFTRETLGDIENEDFREAAAGGSGQVKSEDEAWFIELFWEQYLGDFENATLGLREAKSIEDLEFWIKEIQRQVASWPQGGDA